MILVCSAALSGGTVGVDVILERSDKVMNPKNLQGAFTIQLISKRNDVRVIKAEAYQKLVSETRTDRLFVFTYPPSVRKTGLLVHSFLDTDEDSMWIYLPAVGKIKRVALDTAGGGYFMGSDFTYSDFVSRSTQEFIYTLQGEKMVGADACYELLSVGRDKSVKKKYGYSKELKYYRKSDYVLMKIIYYDLAGELLKVYTVDEVKTLGEYLYPVKVGMKNMQTGHRSVIEFTELEAPKNISDKYFTYRYLQNQ